MRQLAGLAAFPPRRWRSVMQPQARWRRQVRLGRESRTVLEHALGRPGRPLVGDGQFVGYP